MYLFHIVRFISFVLASIFLIGSFIFWLAVGDIAMAQIYVLQAICQYVIYIALNVGIRN